MSSPYVVVRDPVDGHMFIYNTVTMAWEAWGGTVTIGGPVVIGTVNQGTGGTSPWLTWTGLQIPAHDYASLSYTGNNLTGVVYKTGGAGGVTVATLTLAYTGANLISVTKT